MLLWIVVNPNYFEFLTLKGPMEIGPFIFNNNFKY